MICARNLNDPILYMVATLNIDLEKTREINRQQAQHSINVDAKVLFDKKHTPINLQVGQNALIKLHHGYKIELYLGGLVAFHHH